MSERVAMGLFYAGGFLLTIVVLLGLQLLGAPVEVMVLGWMVILSGGGIAAGRLTMHYGPSGRGRKGE